MKPSDQNYVPLPCPLAVAGLLGEGALKHELVSLVVEIVVKIVPQQAVDQDSLTLEIISQCCSSQSGVQSSSNGVQLLHNLKCAGEIEVTLGADLIQCSPVLSLQLVEDLLSTLDCLRSCVS